MRSQHFTHQERLKADVARLLTGKGAPPAPRLVESVPARPVAAPVPAEAVFKKLDLSAPLAVESVAPGLRALSHPEPLVRTLRGTRFEPPVPPPRANPIA
jgi:hypothetical protein